MITFNIDGENDGLLHPWEGAATKIHCINAREHRAENSLEFTMDNIEEFVEFIKSHGDGGLIIVGHNIIGYDLPLWEKLLGFTYEINMETMGFEAYPDRFLDIPCRFVDTYILSRLLDPDRQGHGVEYFAKKHGQAKVEIPDWVGLPISDYLERCSEDTRIQDQLVYGDLLAEAKKFGKDIRPAYEREKAVEYIIGEQKRHGVLFNREKAEENLVVLDKWMKELAEKIEPLFPKRVLPKSKQPKFPANPFKQDSSVSTHGVNFCKNMGVDEDGYVSYLEECIKAAGDLEGKDRAEYLIAIGKCANQAAMTMADQQDIKAWVIATYGWEPEFWNVKVEGRKKTKTTPKWHEAKAICPDLQRIGREVGFVKDLMLWLTYRNRRSVIKSKTQDTGWLNHPRLAIDGRIPADANTIGALTKRFTHKGVANVPRASSVFGEEMRGLFCVADDRRMVGWDAQGLEDRLKAHYCYDYPGGREYADKLLDPDYDGHGENTTDWFGLTPDDEGFKEKRNEYSKSGLYCLAYGGQVPTFAKCLGIPKEEAQIKFDAWWEKNNPLYLFKTDLERAWKRDGQMLTSIDGSPLRPRKGHALVNTIIQNAGAVLMKEAMVLCYREIKNLGLDSFQIIHYHDEQQNESAPECAELTGQIGVWSIEEAGRRLGIKVPMTASYDIGQSWAETH